MSITSKIWDPNNTLKWSPTMQLRRYDDTPNLVNIRLQQLFISMMDDGSPLSEWRDIELVHDFNWNRNQ